MDPQQAQALYGSHYAAMYDELWEENPAWAPEAKLHVEWLGRQLNPDMRWLDVGCGTGWILSQFPEITRAGIDLSPAMLERARSANPDAIEFRQGDIRDDIPDWFGAWDLVSSTGHAWCYVSSVGEVERIAENMARWAAPTGTVFVQPPDLCDLTGLAMDYDFTGRPRVENGLSITGVIWNYYDEGGTHEHMIWPSLDVWVRWFSQWFRRIEVVTWPREPDFLPCPRKILLAKHKRGHDDLAPAEIVVHPDPASPEQTEPEVLVSHVPATPLERRTPEPVRLVDRSLSDLVARAAPWKPSFWRSARFRAGRAIRR